MGRLGQVVGKTAAAAYATLVLAILFFSFPFTGWRALSVQTGSMVPAIRPGALVIDHSAAVNDLNVGDVITYRTLKDPNMTITHRIVDFQYRGVLRDVVVKGDANPRPDPPVLASQIVGRVVVSIPYAGRAVDLMHTLPGILLLIYIPALAIIIYELQLLVRRLTDLELQGLVPLGRPSRIIRFKPTRMVYTIRSGAHGPRIIRRIGILPIIFIFFVSLALGTHATLARLQDKAALTRSTISASRSQGHHGDQDTDGDADDGHGD